jgi:hypothetical protein
VTVKEFIVVASLLEMSATDLLVSCAESRAAENTANTGETNISLHLEHLSKKVPGGFTIVVQPPFIIIGDEPADVVHRRALSTVKWAVAKLKQDFFQQDPQETIDIWLFKDDASYTNHAQLLFHDTPTSRFGYYSAANRALIMNIATGGGTLVHEIVHPFMRENFPACPPWFNEGLASLYEASAEKEGHIQGLINWRFKILEKAIKACKTVSFEKLTSMSETEFYGGTSYSDYYAQARYLCYYLQEKALLIKFYKEFKAKAKWDPTGYATLQHVLGESDMLAFQKKWEEFILGVRKP